MGREHALANLHLQPTGRWGHTEYSMEYHPDYLASRCGCDPEDDNFKKAWQKQLEIDFNFYINDGLINWGEAGRVTDMGHAVYAEDGSDQHQPAECPFETPEEVWNFDAVDEYGLPDEAEQVAEYERIMQSFRRDFPDQLYPGGTYKTLVSGAIQTFGWDMLLLAASDPDKLEKVLDSFFRRSLFFYKCWAQTSAEAVLTHDDFVWTSGAFMNPEIYRNVIIPRYAELWKVVHDAGKKVLFCSDGNFMDFAEDVAEAGADALIFEPVNDFGFMVDHFHDRCCLVGSYVDCRDLTFQRWEKVQADIERTFERLQECRGAIVAVGNHLPANIPEDMLDRYYKAVLPRLER